MAKRFTDTEKWNDPWHRKDLTPTYKRFWDYLNAKCDRSGVWKVDVDQASFFINDPIDPDHALAVFGPKRIKVLTPEYWQILGFVPFQFGTLSEDCRSHKDVFSLIKSHRVSKGYQYPTNTLKDKDKEEDKEKDKEAAREILAHFNATCRKSLKLTEDRKNLVARRLDEGRTVEEMKAAITNFSKDDWPDRAKFMDLVYAIGMRNKIDNLEKWLNYQPKQPASASPAWMNQ